MGVEQYYQHAKAEHFQIDNTAHKIMASKIPSIHKALGDKVKGYSEKEWLKCAYQVMFDGVLAKFSQNPDHAQTLKSTGVMKLAESSKNDKYWGTGKSLYDKTALTEWEGANKLGKILMMVRDKL